MSVSGHSLPRAIEYGLMFAQIFLHLFLFWPAFAEQAPPSEFSSHYQEGISLYREQKFEEALSEFQAAEALMPRNAALMTNLGLSFYQLEQDGQAVAYFRKALSLDPNNERAKEALDFGLKRLSSQAKQSENSQLSWLMLALVRPSSIELLLLFSLFSFFAAGWTLLSYVGRRRRALRDETALPQLPWLAGLLSLSFLIMLSLTGLKYMDQQIIRATVIADPQISAHSGPSEDYPSLFDLMEGAEIQVSTTQDEWAQIENSEGFKGWVPLSSLMITTGQQ